MHGYHHTQLPCQRQPGQHGFRSDKYNQYAGKLIHRCRGSGRAAVLVMMISLQTRTYSTRVKLGLDRCEADVVLANQRRIQAVEIQQQDEFVIETFTTQHTTHTQTDAAQHTAMRHEQYDALRNSTRSPVAWVFSRKRICVHRYTANTIKN